MMSQLWHLLFLSYACVIGGIRTKGHSFLVWYSIDREDQESESGFLCKKHFFVEKTVLIQSAHGAVYLDTNSLLVADVK